MTHPQAEDIRRASDMLCPDRRLLATPDDAMSDPLAWHLSSFTVQHGRPFTYHCLLLQSMGVSTLKGRLGWVMYQALAQQSRLGLAGKALVDKEAPRGLDISGKSASCESPNGQGEQ